MAVATASKVLTNPGTLPRDSAQLIHRTPVFGLNITPHANFENGLRLAKTAEDLGLNIIGVQDHPYNGSYLDTWSLLAALAVSTKKIRYFADVTDLPMRPPAMLAKAAASLDIITNGRIELGIGAGAYWDAIHSYGGPRRSPAESIAALEEAITIIRLLWNYDLPKNRASFQGKYYQLDNAAAGPSPHHNIQIWIGAAKPRMFRLIGKMGDGWVIPLTTYYSREDLTIGQREIDAAAIRNGRMLDSIARIANIVGTIDERDRLSQSKGDKSPLVGSTSEWTDWIVSSYRLGVDTFVFWPMVEEEGEEQLRLFAGEVIPMVRASLEENIT
jgi:alkanesulfonate monooxygenase SsuD/methylene tetrahydromethanopterin reductase-like flavin-dependent oxidoreductase (luciferase family)